MIAAIDGSQTGDIKTDQVVGAWGCSSDSRRRSIDGDRVYQIENGSKLQAFDIETGQSMWRQELGTVQKAPPVLADGKIYVGTESGKFFILRPLADRGEMLSEVELPISTNSVSRPKARRSRCWPARRFRAAASSSCRAMRCMRSGRRRPKAGDRAWRSTSLR